MRNSYFKNFLSICGLISGSFISYHSVYAQIIRPKYHKIVRSTEKHLEKEYSNSKFLTSFPRKEEETPLGWWIQDYVATMDPALGKPTPEVLLPEMMGLTQKSVSNRAQPGAAKTQWERRGPNNLAGRSRCVEFDPTEASGKKVWAGAVTGGLWYNNDITSASSKWQAVSDLWANITVTAIAFDPNTPGTMYVGTGEGWGTTTSSSRGYGIYKSVDSGKTFQHLTSTANYYYINDIIVRNESGKSVVYAAVDVLWFAGTWHGGATSPGIYRSTDGGNNFTNLNIRLSGQSFNISPADFELDAYNRLWVGTKQNAATGTSDKGGGRIIYTDNGTTFSIAYSYTGGTSSRVELGVSPNYLAVYAMIERSGKADTLIKSLNRGVTWQKMTKPVDADNGIAKTDFSRNQAWYDWIINVSPKDSNLLVCGAIDMFYSKNGGTTWGQISKWSNNPGLDKLTCSYVHADIHAITFNADGKRLLIGCDGGVFYAPDINNNPTTNSNCILERNNELLITQFYWGDISQTKGSNFMIAGAQDNGTHGFTTAGLNNKNMITGGDGGYCFISSLNDNKQIMSYVYNQFFGTSNNWSSFTKLIDDPTSGKFINPAVFEPLNDFIFTGKAAGTIYRNKLGNTASSASTISFGATSLGSPSAFCASKSATTGKAMIYIGTDAGKLLVTNDASVTSPTFTNITGSINAGNISSIFRNKLSDTIFVTLSNYGVTNVYFSGDAGKTWTAKDGNLPNMPVWSIAVNPNKLGEALIATELGIYGTSNIFASSVVWTPYNNGIGPVKTMAIRYRDNDRTLMAVTHGRGVFTSDAWSKESPITKFGSDKQGVCATETVNFIDSSLNSPTEWLWTITPNSGVVFKSGTSNASKNPKVQFTKGGVYEISLEAGNSLGSEVLVKKNFITVVDSIIMGAEMKKSKEKLCAADTFSYWIKTMDTTIKEIQLTYEWSKNGQSISGNDTNVILNIFPVVKDIYQCKVSTNQYCVSPKFVVLKDSIDAVSGVKTLNITRFMDTLKAENVGTGSYKWYKDGIYQGSGQWFKAISNGNYRCVYEENNCSSDSSNLLNFNALTINKSIESNQCFIYPSSTEDLVYLKNSQDLRQLLIYNMTGQLVCKLNTANISSNMLSLKQLGLKPGLYNFKLLNKSLDVLRTQKIIYQGQ